MTSLGHASGGRHPSNDVPRSPRGWSVVHEFESTADLLGDSAATSGDPARLKAWWVYRMLFGPDPLTERLTLLWHNHFATNNLKVENLAFMRRQNELFRQLGRATGHRAGRQLSEPEPIAFPEHGDLAYSPARSRGSHGTGLAGPRPR
jgi:hypothetical protein